MLNNEKFKRNFKIISWCVLTITFIAALALAIMYFVITSENINVNDQLEKWKQDFLKYYAATNALIVSLNIPFWMVKIWLLIDGVTMKIHRDKTKKKMAKNAYKLISSKVLNNKQTAEILSTQKNKIEYIINYFANYGARLTKDEAIYILKNLKKENAWDLKNYITQRCYINISIDEIVKLINEKNKVTT